MTDKLNTSRAILSMTTCSPPGTYLNGACQAQMRFVGLTFVDKDNSEILRVEMTLDQLAGLLTTNSYVPVTLRRYRDAEGNYTGDEVEPPETVGEKTSEEMKRVQDSLEGRLSDLIGDLKEIVDGKKRAGKKVIEGLIHQAEIVQSHAKSNQEFVLHEAQESVNEMKDDAFRQLMHEFADGTGNVEAAKLLCTAFQHDDVKLLADGGDVPRIEEEYEPKNRDVSIEDMNGREIAEALESVIRCYDNEKEDRGYRTSLFQPRVMFDRGRIIVSYVSYQGRSKLTVERARAYLKFLTKGEFKQHHHLDLGDS